MSDPTVTSTDYFAADAAGGFTVATADADAVALANSRYGFARFLAATTDDQRRSRNEATGRVDRAYRWQGQKYGPLAGIVQTLEFPRVPHLRVGRPSCEFAGIVAPVNGACLLGAVWDWDAANQIAVVPQNILLAVLYEADSMLAGTARDQRQQAIADGVTGQAVGSVNEQYVRQGVVPGSRPVLCIRADDLVRQYQLTTGNIQ